MAVTAARSARQPRAMACSGSSDMQASDFSSETMLVCEEEQSAGHPSRQSKRCSPSSQLAPSPARAADGGNSKRVRAEHGGAVSGVGFGSSDFGVGGSSGGRGGDVHDGKPHVSCEAGLRAPLPVLTELMPMRGRPSAYAPVIQRWNS